jgi:hypothetical protein
LNSCLEGRRKGARNRERKKKGGKPGEEKKEYCQTFPNLFRKRGGEMIK